MEGESIQILSERTVGDVRTYQLVPMPSERWQGGLERALRRWRSEVGRLAAGVELGSRGFDELFASGVDQRNSPELDRLAAELVRTVNRASGREQGDTG